MIDRLLGWSAGLAIVLLFAACGGDGGGSGGDTEVPIAGGLDQVAPTITYVTPSNGATGVATNTRLTVTFSEPMDESSLGPAIGLVDETSGSPVALTVVFDVMNRIATATPAVALAVDRSYRAQVSTAARDLAGRALAQSYAWTFTTGSAPDTTAPTVTSFAPRDGAVAVPARTTIAMSFSEPMDVGSVGAAFALTRGSEAVAGTIAYIGQAAVFQPDAPLAPGAAYVATLRRSAADLAGNRLAADLSWTFTTGSAVDTSPPVVLAVSPAPGASGVARDAALSVTFDEPIYPFVYGMIDGVLVEVAIDYTNLTVHMRPTAPLRAAASYEGSVRASDLAGNTMDPPYRWSFATAP